MTSFKQVAANRANARKSIGPTTDEGEQRSRCNAVRHGLTAETVIAALEDADDYNAFEAAIAAGRTVGCRARACVAARGLALAAAPGYCDRTRSVRHSAICGR